MAGSRTGKVFALSLGKGLTSLVALLAAMVLSRVLSKADLATYRQTLLAYEVVLPLLSLGLVSGIYYFLPTEKTRMRGVVVDGVLLMAAMGLLYAVFIALGGNHLLARRFSNPAVANTLVYLVPLPIVTLPAGLLAPVMVVRNQVRALSLYNVLASLFLAAGVVLACLWWRTPEAMVGVRVGLGVPIGLWAIGLMFRSVPQDGWRPRWESMVGMAAYSIPLAGALALGTLSLQLDKLIVAAMCTPEQFAVYSNGAIEIPLIHILTGSISSVLIVDFRTAFAAGNHAEALKLYRLVPAKTSLFLFPVMVFLALAAQPIIRVLFTARYAASATVFTLYLLMIPCRTIMAGGLVAAGMSRLVFRNSAIGLVINLALSVPLVHWIGYLGAVVGTLASLGLWELPATLRGIGRSIQTPAWRVYPWRAAGWNLLLALAAGLPAAAALRVVHPGGPVAELAVSAPVYATAYLALLWATGRMEPKRLAARLWGGHGA